MQSRSKEAPGSPERDAGELVRARGDEQVEVQAFRLFRRRGAKPALLARYTDALAVAAACGDGYIKALV